MAHKQNKASMNYTLRLPWNANPGCHYEILAGADSTSPGSVLNAAGAMVILKVSV
jgi:hypothetical protein